MALFYFLYGYTSALGTAPPTVYGHTLGLSLTPTIRLLWFALGPYLLRNVGYGLFGFTRMPLPWLGAVIVTDAALLTGFWRWSRGRAWHVDSRAAWMGLALAAGFVVPLIGRADGGIAGRHLVIPVVGAAVVLLRAFVVRGPSRRLQTIALAAGLAVAQGNAWIQTVACRINGAFHEAVSRRSGELQKADLVVIDLDSFDRNIPSTWFPVDFDLTNTYYGAEAFQDWGVISMVRLAAGEPEKPVYLATKSPVRAGDQLRFVRGYATGSRAFRSRAIAIASAGVEVISFNDVFGDQFDDGLGRPSMPISRAAHSPAIGRGGSQVLVLPSHAAP